VNFLTWIADPARWSGAGGIPVRVFEHLQLAVLPLVAAALVAIPAGVVMGHLRRWGLLAVSIINVGRAIPSFAVVAVALPVSIRLGLGLGFWPTVLALFLLALPPMFTNAYTSIRESPPEAVESARGMGMRERDVLLGVELPLASPIIFAAARVSAVQVVATATLGALVGAGGLGRFIVDGLAQQDYAQLFGGAVLVAVLSVLTELAFGLLERIALPKGIRRAAVGVADRPV
jgi:osmoprotectant transport system permease protein